MVDIPNDYLAGPAENATIERIDFKSRLPVYDGLYAVWIHNVFSAQECQKMVEYAEKHGDWERGLVNVGGGMQAMREDIRKCDRIMWDNKDIAARIWNRVAPLVPELLNVKNWSQLNRGLVKHDNLQMTRLNERLRFLRYGKDEYFKAHQDGSYSTPDRSERSWFTLHVYLNDTDHQPDDSKLVGGATTFWSWDLQQRIEIPPQRGSVLIFQHEGLLHSGDEVLEGSKITLRTDIMYKSI